MLDSAGQHDDAAAKLAPTVAAAACFADARPSRPTHVACPQQRNGYDCGVFALAFAEALVVAGGEAAAEDVEGAVSGVSQERVRELRARMRDLCRGELAV